MLEQALQFIQTPSGVFITSIIIALILVLNPYKLIRYKFNDRDIGLLIIFAGSIYFQYHIISVETGVQNVLDGIAHWITVGAVIGILFRQILEVEW